MKRFVGLASLAFVCPLLAQAPSVPATVIQPAGQPVSQPAAQPSKPAKPATYDEKADAKAQIAAAVARASKENRRVLIQWGANWCGWCHKLHDTLKTDAKAKRVMMYEFDLVLVDIGRFDKNMDIAAGYGADLKKAGVPFLTVLDGSGKAIANQETGGLELPSSKETPYPGHDPAKVIAFLDSHKAAYLEASAVLAAGIERAKNENKIVFLHFGAPWCVWCHRLEDWMAKPEVVAILGKQFVDVKIDTDRMIGGKDVEAVHRDNAKGGIPGFAFINPADGKKIATSDGPKGNVGFPAQPEEIEHFIAMLKTCKNITADDAATLKKSLEAKPQGH
ncbi:MAG: thioredoxin family protein [Phycisphaerales bacterium]